MEEKCKVSKSDHSFDGSPGLMANLQVNVKIEPQWMLESEPKIEDCASWKAGKHSQDIKCEDITDWENGKCDTSAVPEDPLAPENMKTDHLTESGGVVTADQNKHGKRVYTNDHPLSKKTKSELIEDIIKEEMSILSASQEGLDNSVLPAAATESEGDARSSPVPLPTEVEKPRSHQHSLKGKMCQVCGLVFASKAQKKKHQRTHPVGVKVHHCNFCNKWFEYLHQIEFHKCLPTKQEKPHKCAISGSGFAEVGELMAHKQSKHMQKCPDCDLLFATKLEKKKHQYQATPPVKFHPCVACNEWFPHLCDFERHKRHPKHIYNQKKPQKCPVRDLAVATKRKKKETQSNTHIRREDTSMCCV